MNVLVTGGSGLVGRYVVDELAKYYSVQVVDIKPLHRLDIPVHLVDILDLSAISKTVNNIDVIVHLAGIPHPLSEPPEKVFRVNILGTFNVLEAAASRGVKQVILMSSESTLGFAFSSTRQWPDYIPLDEEHPLRPQDAYGLSKVASELLCAGITRKTGIRTHCLRAPWIWVPEEKERYRELIQEYAKWYKNLWAFIHVFDVVQAVRLLIESQKDKRLEIPAHDVYFISAEHNWTGRESRDLVREFYPEIRVIADSFQGPSSLISCSKAKQTLGFVPRYGVSDVFQT